MLGMNISRAFICEKLDFTIFSWSVGQSPRGNIFRVLHLEFWRGPRAWTRPGPLARAMDPLGAQGPAGPCAGALGLVGP